MAEVCAVTTTTYSPATEASFLGGFVAAEGCFTRRAEDSKFTFSVALGAIDAGVCDRLRELLGCGCVGWYARRQPHYDDEAVFVVRKTTDLVEVVVPFMDAHLPASHKREQYLTWRRDLLDYWEYRFPRARMCGVEGCFRPHRAHGLCRAHYYMTFGR